jgi:hypothetical protein
MLIMRGYVRTFNARGGESLKEEWSRQQVGAPFPVTCRPTIAPRDLLIRRVS